MPTMAYQLVGDLMLLVHQHTEPSQDEWSEYAASVREAVGRKSLRALLVVTDGAGPNPRQRKEIVEAFSDGPVLVAICSSSRIARAITTAISWFYPQPMRSFDDSKIEDALRFLQVDSGLWRRIFAAIDNMESRLRFAA